MKIIAEGLANQRSALAPEALLRERVATASICCGALLHQGKKVDVLLEELDKQERGEKSSFAGDGAGFIIILRAASSTCICPCSALACSTPGSTPS